VRDFCIRKLQLVASKIVDQRRIVGVVHLFQHQTQHGVTEVAVLKIVFCSQANTAYSAKHRLFAHAAKVVVADKKIPYHRRFKIITVVARSVRKQLLDCGILFVARQGQVVVQRIVKGNFVIPYRFIYQRRRESLGQRADFIGMRHLRKLLAVVAVHLVGRLPVPYHADGNHRIGIVCCCVLQCVDKSQICQLSRLTCSVSHKCTCRQRNQKHHRQCNDNFCFARAIPVKNKVSTRALFVLRVWRAESRRQKLFLLQNLQVQHRHGKQHKRQMDVVEKANKQSDVHQIEPEESRVATNAVYARGHKFGFVLGRYTCTPTVAHGDHCHNKHRNAHRRNAYAKPSVGGTPHAEVKHNACHLYRHDGIGGNLHEQLHDKYFAWFVALADLVGFDAAAPLQNHFCKICDVKRRHHGKRRPLYSCHNYLNTDIQKLRSKCKRLRKFVIFFLVRMQNFITFPSQLSTKDTSKRRRQPSATSNTIINVKPTAKNTVPKLECLPCDISGMSSSTTTYIIAPAAKLSK